MLNILATPAYLPFAVALAIMAMIAIVEALGALIGIGISGLLDGLFFELDADIDTGEAQLGTSNWLGWEICRQSTCINTTGATTYFFRVVWIIDPKHQS